MIGKIKILVVDDSAFMRKSLSLLLESDSNIEVIDTAIDGLDAIETTLILQGVISSVLAGCVFGDQVDADTIRQRPGLVRHDQERDRQQGRCGQYMQCPKPVRFRRLLRGL